MKLKIPLLNSNWGRKKNISNLFGLIKSKVIFEDGFISYVSRDIRLSKIVDTRGVYYDATKPSLLEAHAQNKVDIEYTKSLLNKLKFNSVSKYNSEREYSGSLPSKFILVVDQIKGDLSVKYGYSNANSFKLMLAKALSENPEHHIIVKVHPDVYTRKKKGFIDIESIKNLPRVQIINENCHPIRLIREADSIYTVTSQVGFEALIWNKKVKCFGMPFYAGWGLTTDYLEAPKRRFNLNMEQLAHAALVKYTTYYHPETNNVCSIDEIIEFIGFQRRMRFRFPTTMYAYGFSPWKIPIIKSFTQGSKLIFVKSLECVPENSTLIVWGSLNCDSLASSIKIIRVEDGFLRSVGLGGDFIFPYSWVFDDVGIYYDSRRPSKLENILNEYDFTSLELSQAKKLISNLISNNISKYNLGDANFKINNNGKSCLLVVGQVEDDASIRYGTGRIGNNLELLKEVRAKFPNAFIIYKPHPDIVEGIRKKGSKTIGENLYYDLKVTSGDASSLFDYVESVHTMTSLVGFEALIRNKKVYTYGSPFYAGWGLSFDLIVVKRRKRKLTLDELVAGVLIRYPTYVSKISKMYTKPEQVINELVQQRHSCGIRMPLWRKFIRDIVRILTHFKIGKNS